MHLRCCESAVHVCVCVRDTAFFSTYVSSIFRGCMESARVPMRHQAVATEL